MELDVEGGTADLLEGFRSFTAALTLSTPVTTPARTLASTNPSTITSTAVLEPAITEGQSPAEPPETGAEEELPSETSSGSQPDAPKRRPAPKAPTFLNDLDLTKTSVQLADFVQGKNPEATWISMP